ncbi:pyridoxal phosphate-dependent aminotransferase [Rossellomorea aquimaris]|uniref:MalY/PatB family protein n=1 Tax=Rossellomorea aquimaris TaxID=189382 RepID=UPI001CD2A449|nr:MalY/PatB family protein [Rossellomorea aquimaris]MCA1057231.1 pyridoxal phosphate-dependent aminotransferase [Rossellomorea aquimaris]
MNDFEKVIDRTGTSSVKWDMTKTVFGKDDVLPMWVADMDFLPPAEVTEALKNRLEHGIFGYTFVGDGPREAIVEWIQKRHGWSIHKDWLQYSPGVVPAIGTIIQALTEPGDKVLVQSPVYTPFFNMTEENGRVVENAPLDYIDGTYRISFEDFEESLKKGVKLFLLCNPHNPSGRVWTREELTKMAELCKKYSVIIVSDEIHSDLVYEEHAHTPIASIDESYLDSVITCIAPSKTFNLAGLQASAMITPNKHFRDSIAEVHKRQGFFTLNTFGITGMEAAYRHGEKWLEDILDYLKENVNRTKSFLEERLPDLHLVDPEGTYLLWIDCRKLGLSDDELKERLLEKGKLGLEPGPKYGKGGEGFVRMNIACPREILEDGLSRLYKALGE